MPPSATGERDQTPDALVASATRVEDGTTAELIPLTAAEADTDWWHRAAPAILELPRITAGGPRPGRRAPRSATAAWGYVVLAVVFVPVTVTALCLALGAQVIHGHGRPTRVLVGWPWMHYLGALPRGAIYAVWLVPIADWALLAAGQAHYRLRFKRARRGRFRLLIIQITTTGNEARRVNEIIAQICSYGLRMPHEIWVVTEPWGAVTNREGYPGAKHVLVVPETFTARSERKARALEFSRQIRELLGLDTADVKILFQRRRRDADRELHQDRVRGQL